MKISASIILVVALVLASLYARSEAALVSAEVTACLKIADAIPALKAIYPVWTQANIEGCTAAGLTCDDSGQHVQGLTVSVSDGAFPPEISALTSMTTLSLSAVFTGTLPESWSSLNNLVSLTLRYIVNGTIPASWSAMTSLQEFNIGFYEAGPMTLPSWLGNVPTLSFDSPELTEFPSFMASTNAVKVFLLANAIVPAGSIPGAVFQSTVLESFTISTTDQTFATGSTLPSLAGMTALKMLSLSNIGIGGTIPSGMPPNLEFIALAVLPNLQGALPQTLMDLPKLNRIYMNGLSGLSGGLPGPTTPASSKLQRYDAYNMGISGTISPNLLSIPTLTDLLIDSSTATGGIPEIPSPLTVTSLVSLQIINNQALQGTIPSSYAQLPSISILSFSNNKMTGPIPSAYANSTGPLNNLNLGYNSLTGTLPFILLKGTFPTLDITECGLTGTIPVEYGGRTFSRISFAGNSFDLCANNGTEGQASLYSGFQSTSTCSLQATSGRTDCPCYGSWPDKCFTDACAPEFLPPTAPAAPEAGPSSTPTNQPSSTPSATPTAPTGTPAAVPTISAPAFVPIGAASSISFGLVAFVIASIAVLYAM